MSVPASTFKRSHGPHPRLRQSLLAVAAVIALAGACTAPPTATPGPPAPTATPGPAATVTFETSPAGTINPSGTHTYPIGTAIDITVRANDPAWKPGLMVDETPVALAAQPDSSATYRLTVDGDHILQATFAQFAKEVHPIDSATVAVLVEIAPDGKRVVFSASTPFLDALAPGDFLVDQVGSGLVEKFKTPLLVRVLAIDRTGPGVVLSTEPAKLTEVVENASVKLTFPLSLGEGQSSSLGGQLAALGPLAPPLRGTLAGSQPTGLFALHIQKTWSASSGGATGTVTASGDVSISQPTLEFEWEQSLFDTQRFLLALRENPSAGLNVHVGSSLTLEGEAKLLERDLPTLWFSVAGLPVWVKTHLEAGVGAKLEAKAAVEAEVTLSATARSGVLYEKSGGWSPISELTPQFNGQVSLAAEAAAEAYPYLRPTFYIYGLCGPYLDVRPGTVGFTASITADPWWKLDAGFEIRGGADCVFTDPWQFPKTLGASKTVAMATSPAPTASPTPTDYAVYHTRWAVAGKSGDLVVIAWGKRLIVWATAAVFPCSKLQSGGDSWFVQSPDGTFQRLPSLDDTDSVAQLAVKDVTATASKGTLRFVGLGFQAGCSTSTLGWTASLVGVGPETAKTTLDRYSPNTEGNAMQLDCLSDPTCSPPTTAT